MKNYSQISYSDLSFFRFYRLIKLSITPNVSITRTQLLLVAIVAVVHTPHHLLS